MSRYPSTFDGVCVGMVFASKDDPAQRGGYKVRQIHPPHGNNVQDDHIHFEPPMQTPNQLGVTSFPRPPEDGTVCYFIKDKTLGKLIMLGTEESSVISQQGQTGTPGNSNPYGYDRYVGEPQRIYKPPEVEKQTERGAEVYKIKDQNGENDEWKNQLVQGIQGQAGLPPLNGVFPNGISNIPTAIQQFSSILSGNALGNLPGVNLAIGKIFDLMPSSNKNEIFNNMPREMSLALTSILSLIQNVEYGTNSTFATIGRVNQDVYIQNAIELFSDTSKINNMRDLYGIFRRLQTDTTLFGLDQLEDYIQEVETLFGNISQAIDYDGNTKNSSGQDVLSAITSFASAFGGLTGASPGLSHFDSKGASNLAEMITRMKPEVGAKAKENMNIETISKALTTWLGTLAF